MKFNLLNKLRISSAVIGIAGAALLTFSGMASAATAGCYQYNANGFVTSATPVFNNICGTPEGINDESNFVRVRQDTNGNDEDNTNNSAYTVGTLNSACESGSNYDVWNYLHNDATSDDNDNGSGSAVAHNVQTHLTADLNKTSTSFNFGDTVTASNAASVSDSAVLDCGTSQVKLSLVPGSVHIYSIPYAAWDNLSDSSINGTTTLGSPTLGSGDMWGCWNYRMVIVYQVTVTKIATPPTVAGVCTLLSVEANSDRQVTISNLTDQTTGTSLKDVVINWGDNSTDTYTSLSSAISQTHTYSTTGSYVVYATMDFTAAGQSDITSGGANSDCAKEVTFNTTTPPTVTPPTTIITTSTPSTPSTPSQLVNTGPGSVIGIFAAVSAIATVGYRYFLGRKVTN
jgi:hypothetical protein